MIKFKIVNTLLILIYDTSTGSNNWVIENLKELGEFNLKGIFTFKKTDFFKNGNHDSPVEFILGKLEHDYFKIEGRKLGISKDLYIHMDVKVKKDFFIASRNISVFKHISNLLNEDIFLGGFQENSIPIGDFIKLLENFPKNYELKKYVDARLSSILKNYFDSTIDAEDKYNSYMNKKISKKGSNIYKILQDTEIQKFELISEKLHEMLNTENEYNEKQWQEEMLEIIRFLYPKYIHVFKETKVQDSDGKARRLDYLLIDVDGNIDIVEIKKPFDNCIVTKSKYRDNYIPLRELSGTVMQIEKYIFYLNRWGEKGEKKLTSKYKNKLPKDFKIKITNPSGLIIMGRDVQLNDRQKRDFEVIKRKYKNIIDILTYDDLLRRLTCIIAQLKLLNK